jgi:hypothetical protein
MYFSIIPFTHLVEEGEGRTLAVCFDDAELDHDVQPLVGSRLCGGPLKFNQCNRRSKALGSANLSTGQMNLAQLPEARPLALRDAWRDGLEIPIVG